ncbi:transglutaminase family protein [Aeromicrobium sp.]|uniref:transglutaminase family protein n=1 Tax=Aeromicrobium sp. TaxID=1871063 RepID=UPI003D6A21D8
MQLRIKHVTGYRYEKGAVASFNEARMTPLTTTDQMVLRSRLEITPSPWASEYRDYWGSTVTAFEVNEPHAELTVVATSIVQTSSVETVPERLPWEALDAVQDEWCEYLEISPWVAPSPALLAQLEPIRAGAATPTDHAEAVCAFMFENIRYVEGATEVTTVAADAWEARTGVCQDFAHLTLGALRQARIPARYVSGYLHPSTDPVVGEEVVGESHAWIEWWDGAWVGWDPTNARPVGEQHVLVARGRDYEDVPPLRGIYSTRGDSELFVDVEITRLR